MQGITSMQANQIPHAFLKLTAQVMLVDTQGPLKREYQSVQAMFA